MNWDDLFAALALVLVIEGLMPFISPAGYKENMSQMLKMSDSGLRAVALGSMVAGVFFLYLVRS
ncbi:MAG: DUF2065 domain-containing protein [Gammaproteobacteria bacterium]|nr:DUF2065 domain-containing protein [Gammaproteobacteria bacterium]